MIYLRVSLQKCLKNTLVGFVSHLVHIKQFKKYSRKIYLYKTPNLKLYVLKTLQYTVSKYFSILFYHVNHHVIYLIIDSFNHVKRTERIQ